MKTRLLLLQQAVCLAGLFYVSLMLDNFCGASHSLRFCAIILSLAAFCTLGAFLHGARRTSLLLFGIFTVAQLSLSAMERSPLERYERFYEAIRPGMRAEEVHRLLQVRFPEHGRWPVPVAHASPERLVYILDPHKSEYDAEVVSIEMAHDRVVRAEYLPD